MFVCLPIFRDLLEQIAEFEDKEFAGKKSDTDFKDVLKNMKLVPLNETGGTALLHMVRYRRWHQGTDCSKQKKKNIPIHVQITKSQREVKMLKLAH